MTNRESELRYIGEESYNTQQIEERMRTHIALVVAVFFVLQFAMVSSGEIQIVAERNSNEAATSEFQFERVAPPARNDAATTAKFAIVDGRRDPNGGDVETLHDGQLPTDEDHPANNFFFGAGTRGGRLLIDLGSATDLRKINTYSWHASSRGPQVYELFAAEGNAEGFNPLPKYGMDPEKCGWKRVASIDTRPQERNSGGQYGVSISDSGGSLGKYRYLLFDIARTEARDPFGNTFYSEIDVDDGRPREPITPLPPEPRREVVDVDRGTYLITIDTTETPDLTQWAHDELSARHPAMVSEDREDVAERRL